MIEITLINITPYGQVQLKIIPFGIIERTPGLKYKIDKRSKINPYVRIRRYPYYEDSIDLTVIGNATLYHEVTDFIKTADDLYVQYYMQDVKYTYPIEIEKLPKSSDKLRTMEDTWKLTFSSNYETLSNIDVTEGIFSFSSEHVQEV